VAVHTREVDVQAANASDSVARLPHAPSRLQGSSVIGSRMLRGLMHRVSMAS